MATLDVMLCHAGRASSLLIASGGRKPSLVLGSDIKKLDESPFLAGDAHGIFNSGHIEFAS